MMTVIKGEWHTTVSATPTGSVIIVQRTGGRESTIVIPAQYNLAMCNAIHHAHNDAPAKARQ